MTREETGILSMKRKSQGEVSYKEKGKHGETEKMGNLCVNIGDDH